MKTSVNLLKNDRNIYKNLSGILLRMIAGFFYANAGMFGVYPFGLAFTAVGNVFSAAGAILGYLFLQKDTFRYCLAIIVCVIGKYAVGQAIPLKDEFSYPLFTVWSVLISSLAGMFTVDTGFSANMLFLSSGLFGGAAAYIGVIAKKSFFERKKTTSRMHFFCVCLCLSGLLGGVLALNGIFRHIALMAAFFLLYCLSLKCRLIYSETAAAVLGILFFLTSEDYLLTMITFLVGTVLAGVLRNYGKYPIILSYVIINSIMTIYSKGDIKVFSVFFSIAAAGIIFIIVPNSLITAITKPFSQSTAAETGNAKLKNMIKQRKKAEKIRSEASICDHCKKKFNCWIKNYSYTSDIFTKIKEGSKSGAYRVPSHFSDICPNTDEIVAALGRTETEKEKYRLTFAKASKSKLGQVVCGDTCGIFKTSDNKQILSVIDGMGSGIEAAKQSLKIAKLLERLINEGLEKKDVLRLIRETMIKNELESIVALDLAIIDLKTAKCEFFKAGAAPSYIIRKNDVYEINSSSLPIGILEDEMTEHMKCSLVRGDILVMASDGLMCDDEEKLAILLERIGKNDELDCVEIADSILKFALINKADRKDDVSVIAAKIE